MQKPTPFAIQQLGFPLIGPRFCYRNDFCLEYRGRDLARVVRASQLEIRATKNGWMHGFAMRAGDGSRLKIACKSRSDEAVVNATDVSSTRLQSGSAFVGFPESRNDDARTGHVQAS
jgi:hypothetical protein